MALECNELLRKIKAIQNSKWSLIDILRLTRGADFGQCRLVSFRMRSLLEMTTKLNSEV